MASIVICDRCGERMERLSDRDADRYKVIWDHRRLDLCPKCKEVLGEFLKAADDKSREGYEDASKIAIRFTNEGGVGLTDIMEELGRRRYIAG